MNKHYYYKWRSRTARPCHHGKARPQSGDGGEGLQKQKL